jgi:hypothetical protein
MAIKLSNLEKALMGVIGLDVARPGTSRQALIKSVKALGMGAMRLVPPLARGTGRAALGLGGTLARMSPAGRVGLAGLTLYEANQMGLLDAPIERAKDITADALFEAGEFLPQQTPQQMLEAMQRDQGIKRPKKATKYNRAVRAGMAAAKASQYFGKKGTINNPKRAFVTVNRVASKVNKGKKVSAKGVSGKIARAVRRILK